MRRTRGFTLIELLVVISIIALLIGILLPALGAARRTANQMKNSSQLRGQHQGMVIFANSNNGYLPGLNASGVAYDLYSTGVAADAKSSATPAAREWILLNGQFFTGELAINPVDSKAKWTSGAVTTSNFSYALLSIAAPDATQTDAGRIAEWKDNANSQAVMASDRALSGAGDVTANAGVADANIRSVWTTTNGDWKGNLVWGDNHAGFEQQNKNFQTRYLATTLTGDNLFADSDGVPASATEQGGSRNNNAFMVYYH